MNIQHKKPLFFKVILVAVAVVMSGALAVQPRVEAQASKGADAYCNGKYPSAGGTATEEVKTKRQSCTDGWKGVDCSDKLIYLDQSHVDICTDGAAAASKAGVTDGAAGNDDDSSNNNGTDTKDDKDDDSSSGGNTNSSNNGQSDVLQQMIDQLEDLEKIKSSVDADAQADNHYGSYVNGAGNQQPIHVTKAEGGNNPAIIFINGGGWHTDDGNGQKISPKAVERGYSTFVATYRLGSSGVNYMFEDVMRAIRHVRDNAGMYGIDPNRIAIWGDSAGGSLAMRAAASGKSGLAGAVGWSAPTNAFTAIFRSPESFAIGMDHSTCVPTDLNGVSNVIDILNGGEGDAPDDGGLGNNGTSGLDTPLGTVTQVLKLAQLAQQTSTNVQSLSSKLESSSSSSSSSSDSTSDTSNSGGVSGSGSSASDSDELAQNVRRLTTKKIISCMADFSSASPALFASPLTPPTFLAGFETDPLVGPDQAYQYRDKLRSMGVASSTLILPGEPGPKKEGKNHLDYNEDFVAPSLNFLDKILHPPNEPEQ